MPQGDQSVDALRAALQLSPDNLPLRNLLADTLIELERYSEAETELKAALALKPQDQSLQLRLAQFYWQQGKTSQAIVIVEQITAGSDPAPEALVLHSRLLLFEGNIPSAVARYRQALDLDPDCEDDDLSEKLGVGNQFTDSEVVDGRVRQTYGDETDDFVPTELERPQLTFADVGGMESVKEEIRLKILYPLKHPEMYQAYGQKIGGGIIMYGPPGCGKTYMARATAGEIGAGFISVGINDILDMWVGNSERNLHAIFEQARSHSPCVLFFDEVDALGGRRSDMAGGTQRQLINQFLAEMDGISSSNDGLLILAATNAPWHVDPAFRRPGRFGQILFVPPPDLEARRDILQLHCAGKPTDRLDLQQIAKKTEKFSGADLSQLVDQAVEIKLREALRTGTPQPLTTRDLLAATKRTRPTTKEWFSTAKNYAVYSNEGGIYDDILKYMKLI